MEMVVGDFQGEPPAVWMMREAGQCRVLVVGADTVGKLQRGVDRTQPEDLPGQCPYALIQQPVSISAPADLPAEDIIVHVRPTVIGIVMLQAVGLDKADEHRTHAAQADRRLVPHHPPGQQQPAFRLFAQIHPGDIVGAEVHGIALHDMFGLYRRKHGIDPAERTCPLVLHRRYGKAKVNGEPLFRDVPLPMPSSAACQQQKKQE